MWLRDRSAQYMVWKMMRERKDDGCRRTGRSGQLMDCGMDPMGILYAYLGRYRYL